MDVMETEIHVIFMLYQQCCPFQYTFLFENILWNPELTKIDEIVASLR